MSILSSLLGTTKELFKTVNSREVLSSSILIRVMDLLDSSPETAYDLSIGWTNIILYDSITKPVPANDQE